MTHSVTIAINLVMHRFATVLEALFNEKLIRSVLINGICLFGVGGARRGPHRAPSLTISTSEPISVVLFIGERVA